MTHKSWEHEEEDIRPQKGKSDVEHKRKKREIKRKTRNYRQSRRKRLD